MGEEHETLYGDSSGRWLLVRGPLNLLPPPRVAVGVPLHGTAELDYLGQPGDVVSRLYNQLTAAVKTPGPRRAGNHTPPVQDVLAALLGVGQQAVSRYLSGDSTPRLAPNGWSQLVRATFDPARVAPLFPQTRVVEGLPENTVVVYAPPAPGDPDPDASLARRALIIRDVAVDQPKED